MLPPYTNYHAVFNEKKIAKIFERVIKKHKEELKIVKDHINILKEVGKGSMWNISNCCMVDVEASVFLAMHGYSQNAVANLRIALELVLRQMFLSRFSKQYTESFYEGKKISYPSYKKIVEIIFNTPKFKAFNEINNQWKIADFGTVENKIPNLREEILQLYKELCAYVHPQTHAARMYKTDVKSTGWKEVYEPAYNSNRFLKWFEFLKQLIKIIGIFAAAHGWRRSSKQLARDNFYRYYPEEYDMCKCVWKKPFLPVTYRFKDWFNISGRRTKMNDYWFGRK